MPEGVVSRQYEPALAALPYNRARGSNRLGVSIKRPVKAGGRAIFIGEPRCRRSDGQSDLSLVIGDFLNGERDGGICQFGDGADIFEIEPAAGDVGRNIRFVLVVADYDLHRPSKHLSAKIFDCHLRGGDGCLPAEIGIRTGLIVENTDAYRCRRLRRGGRLQNESRANAYDQRNETHSILPARNQRGARPRGSKRAHYRSNQHPDKGAPKCPRWVTCGRRLGKNFLTLLQHWSGAVTCPACLCGGFGRWP